MSVSRYLYMVSISDNEAQNYEAEAHRLHTPRPSKIYMVPLGSIDNRLSLIVPDILLELLKADVLIGSGLSMLEIRWVK